MRTDFNEEGPRERTLTVLHYCEETEKDGSRVKTRITIPPDRVDFCMASETAHDFVEGTELRKVNLTFMSGNGLEIYITLLDLMTLERSIGAYFLP